MYVYMYVCMCVYMRVYVYMYVFICVYVCMYVHVCVYVCIGGDSEMVSLANRHTDGDIQALVNRVNDFLVSVSSDMPRLTGNHPVFQLQEPLPAAFSISVGGTMAALRKVKVNKATGPDNIPAWILRDFADELAAPLASIYNVQLTA